MRWLIATDDFPPLDGGVATWTAVVARGLAEAGDDVTVLARARPGLHGDGYRVVAVPGPSFGRWGGLWTGLAAGRLRADRVLATTWPVATGLVGRGVPVDVVFHGSDLTRPPRDPRGFRRVVDGAARRLCVSRFLAGLHHAEGRDATVLPAPVDVALGTSSEATSSVQTPSTQTSSGRTSSGPTARWAYVGRATPLKGGDRFVRLVAAAGVSGVVYGDGPAFGAWKALAASLGAAVEFRGRVGRERILAEIGGFDLALLLPRADADGSGAEGFGLSLVEAASRGVAVVGCRTGGVPEATGAGLILDAPDDVAASVAAITSWWTPGRGEACGSWVATHHGVGRVVSALRDVPAGRTADGGRPTADS